MMLRSNGKSFSLAPALALALLALLATAGRSDMGATVQLYPSGWPPWFSGTNCSVWAQVYTSVPAWLMDAKMYLDDDPTPVRAYADDGVHHAPYVTWWGIMFDSSHVMDGSDHDFHFTGHDNVGHSLDYHQTCPAYNKATIFANLFFTQSDQATRDVNAAVSGAGGMNHWATRSTGAGRDIIVGSGTTRIANNTVFYIYTHAGPGWFRDCLDTGTVTAADVTTAVGSKTAAQPPYNFVHIYGCNSAGTTDNHDSSLANAFGVGTPGSDRAFLGFITTVYDDANGEQWCQRVWANLKAGKVLQQAVNDANADGIPDRDAENDHKAQSQCFGDTCMTLHATYYLGPTAQWHN